MPVPSQSICALETGTNRKFLFFVDKHKNIAYYERQEDVAANYHQSTSGVITEKGTKITVASNFISGITYDRGTQFRIYYIWEDTENDGQYLLRETCCSIGGSGDPTWYAGALNDNEISVKQHSLLTAMSQQDGIPMLIYEEPEKHVMWSAFMTTDRSTKEDNWARKKLTLTPDPNQ
jgi:hypothetical protein